ncbi:DoxX family protein [Enterobacter hormaechei]|uniref:DoxX family protein n=1 Tax=Enterobacter hormaechei TaxID=158836 RepID=UPI0020755D31|nr:DoxX family protein [Enterobacter hormaechei]MCM7373419.1 DoxX family protein [Enterobacter hormaechei]
MIIHNPEVISRWIVALIMLAGGVVNTIGVSTIRQEFLRWGLKSWMRIAVGLSELVIAILLMLNILVIPALSLAALLMFAAVLIILLHREHGRAWIPAVVWFLTLLSLSFLV